MNIKTWFKKLLEPNFKVGDRLVDTSDEFPERFSYITITDVGTRNYRYHYDESAMKHQLSITYIDATFEKVNPDNEI